MASSPQQPASRLSPDSDDSPPESEDESSDVAAESLRVFTELAVARTEVEMARESARARAELQRAELETELTQFVLQTQLRIAEFVGKAGSERKRKKKPVAENHDLSPTQTDRERVMLLNLFQCDMIL